MNIERADLLVIGASAAGLKCAARMRRLRPDARIIVVDASQEISVGACGLPYVVSGDIDDADALRETAFEVVRDEKYFAAYKNIDARTGLRVTSIDVEARTVRAASTAGEHMFAYGDLMLAMGASPIVPRGLALSSRVRVVKALDDARVLRSLLETGKIDAVAIVGAGFIGCEMAEAFGAMWGASVTLFEAAPQVLPGMLDADMAALVETELRNHSVDVRTRTLVARIEEADRVCVVPSTGSSIEVDLVVVAVGVAPNTALASNAGIAIGPSGGIIVDEMMHTNQPHVFAAGDCVQCVSAVDGSASLYALGSLANRQGRVAADAMAGRKSRFGPVAGSTIVKAFDVAASATGMTHTAAVARGIEAESVWGTFGDRAHYYPEEQRTFAKMVYERGTRRLVGLQVVGKGDIARLVDVFSTVLLRGGKADGLLELEFAYAPPFAAALDPLHHLGAIAVAQDEDGVRCVGPLEELDGASCLDVRMPAEIEAAPWDGESTQVEMSELRERLDRLPEGELVVLCEKGPRSYEVARWLGKVRGTVVRYLAGGRSMRHRDL